MVRPEVIRRRLENLDGYLKILEGMRRYSLEEFLADPEHYGSAERFLQLAIETLLDMGNHVIAEEGLGTVNQSRDIPRIFRERGLIEPETEESWIRMISFRNILVHAYLELDRRHVHEIIQNHLDDFRAVQRAFARFL
ncbi:type VII toxin-antitoxin system HepT family RNase toxin [Thiohalobacter sp.]|uniref:type VII toxin-antitoxin system HepT family RNase toxin n=1 Tax=Thiohalobacter sp. TaxID=2025948 RepID=UPI0026037780|nr:DUF86 domain-containing protein [Thiohalobacter sp.]